MKEMMIVVNDKSSYFAEVIDSSLQSWKSQCWDLENSPAFGSFIAVDLGDKVVYGVVQQVFTGSDDPVRSVYAYKKTDEELRNEHPQIFQFLKTVFTTIVLGYKQDEIILQTLASHPVLLHTFVRSATSEECRRFLSEPYYLHILFNQEHQLGNFDELLLAMLAQIRKMQVLEQKSLEAFIEQFSLLTGGDYRRLKLFLQRVEQF